MSLRTDTFDLAGLRLTAGEGRRLGLAVAIDPFDLGGERYQVQGSPGPVVLEISRTTGGGYSLLLRFEATLTGACMRCLEPAAPTFAIEAREVSVPGEAEELRSLYVESSVLDVGAWARDAFALALPAAILCAADCAGLCAVCGENLNRAEPGHDHERTADPRWAKLSELRLE